MDGEGERLAHDDELATQLTTSALKLTTADHLSSRANHAAERISFRANHAVNHVSSGDDHAANHVSSSS